MKRYDMFKCEKTNTVIEILVSEEACNEIHGFTKLEEKTQDASTEKHVPYVEEHEEGYFVKVGKETAHPMTEEHYIQFIEIVIDGDRLYRKYLKPGEEPAACFKVKKGTSVVAREYCNIHGLWKNK
ncbi:MAG: desulfoferrodoxin family protein [Fusobacteriaceae bacterium]